MKQKQLPLNLNELAKRYTQTEGGNVQMPIGQVKELLKIFLTDLSGMDFPSLAKLLDKVQKRYGKKG